ncbi:MAG: peroxiredoxin [Paracoccaceae bacterium]|jgi:peroxiredoxin Q/BCP
MIAIGETAPDFTLPATGPEGEGPLTLSALRPAPVVLYFYPKDNTPGCTTEALDFTRLAPEFAALGAVVVGVSKDSLAQHCKFAAKHALGVRLASDAEADTCERYGVWREKSMYGKTFMGIERSTVLIDGAGRVAALWPKVKVKDHAEAVLEAVRQIV